MRVLMISLDRTLLGADYTGDVLERHQKYADLAGQLEIIVLTKKGFKKRKVDDHLTVYPSNSSGKLSYVFDALNLAKNIYWPDKIDLIVTQDPFLTGLAGLLIKKRFKISLLIHFHGDFWDNKYWLMEKGRWWFNWFFLLLSKLIVKQADGIRVVSSGIKKKLAKAGINQHKIKVIPTPVDLEKFSQIDQARVEKLKRQYDARPIILNVGRKDPSKDFKTFFKTIELVCQKFKKMIFLQAGANLQMNYCSDCDQEAIFESLGRLKHKKLIKYYQAADIYLSTSQHESFGKVLIEAMAAGLPVVATQTTGSQEIVKDGENGFLVPIGDKQNLAKKVLFLLNHPQEAKRIGEKGRQMVAKKFHRQKITKQIISFWKEII